MKIVEFVNLTGDFNGFELEDWPSGKEIQKFDQWLLDNEWALPYAHIGRFYQAGAIGDIDYPAILVTKDCPEKILTMIRIKWS